MGHTPARQVQRGPVANGLQRNSEQFRPSARSVGGCCGGVEDRGDGQEVKVRGGERREGIQGREREKRVMVATGRSGKGCKSVCNNGLKMCACLQGGTSSRVPHTIYTQNSTLKKNPK